MSEPVYLGDSVYYELVDGMVRLTTRNGGEPSNSIFLDEQVIYELFRELRRKFGDDAMRRLLT